MQRHRPAEQESRRKTSDKDYEREDRFQSKQKPSRGESSGRGGVPRSPDASSPGTRLSPPTKRTGRGASSGGTRSSKPVKAVSRRRRAST
jgi:hypothetical protein